MSYQGLRLHQTQAGCGWDSDRARAAGGRTSKAARATWAPRGQKRCDRRGEKPSELASRPPSPVVLHTDDPLPAQTKGEPGSQGDSPEAPTTH